MRKDKEIVLKLRKQGKSYNEIIKEIRISKSTLSDWLKNYDWSDNIKNDLTKKASFQNPLKQQYLSKIRGLKLKKLYEDAESEAKLDCELFKNNPLFVSGVMIYWGEGDKVSKNSFRITNSDPAMIRLFVKFLLEICNVKKDKIRASLLLYPDIDPKQAMNFWNKNTGLASSHFTKSIVIKGRHKTKKLQYGICILVVSSSYLKRKMLVWLKLLPKMIN